MDEEKPLEHIPKIVDLPIIQIFGFDGNVVKNKTIKN